MRLILPAILINMVGFMTFWIESVAESIVLGVTSLLCCLAFRETVQVPETSDVTWTEVFMLVNISYQVSVLFIIWASYGRSKRVAMLLDRCCRKIHPQRVGDAIAKTDLKELDVRQSVSAMGRSLSKLKKSQLSVKRFDGTNTSPGPFISSSERKVPQHSPQGNKFTANSGNIRTWNSKTLNTSTSTSAKYCSSTMVPDTQQYGTSRLMAVQESQMETGYSDSEVVDEVYPSWQYESDVNENMHGKSKSQLVQNERQEEQRLTDHELNQQYPKSRKDPYPEEEEEDSGNPESRASTNVDWIGRWFIVPSYIVVMTTLILTGWGFTEDD